MRAFIIAATVAAAVGVSAIANAGDTARVVLEPAAGQSFEVGAGKAVGYFLAKEGQCELTLMVAPVGDIDDVKGAGARVRFDVAPGHTGVFESPEGGALQFTCEAGAKAMSVQPFQRVAFADRKAG
ncbi:MAG: hypothetical protein KJ587_12755 [Alphaproteobacteria bacterium]|nr:hypothetical protein [Alphaproteobacteria bacterium]